jgi:ribokinase
MKKILVIGSTNADLIAGVDRFPVAGETLTGNFFLQAMGGKGANQAMAAQRLGGKVKFVTCVGDDSNGLSAMNYYRENGLDISASLVVKDAPTGTAMILVNGDGENCIIITPGANERLSPEYLARLEDDIRSASFVVIQMEIPYSTIEAICGLARKYSTPLLLNVSPARKVGTDILKLVDILVVNETEVEMISGKTIGTVGEEAVMDSLLAIGVGTVVLTLGDKGSMTKDNKNTYVVPAFNVSAVDTTAAGDTFCGALVAQLSNGVLLKDALKFATAASALCVTRLGAQPSIPSESDVINFMQTDPQFKAHS